MIVVFFCSEKAAMTALLFVCCSPAQHEWKDCSCLFKKLAFSGLLFPWFPVIQAQFEHRFLFLTDFEVVGWRAEGVRVYFIHLNANAVFNSIKRYCFEKTEEESQKPKNNFSSIFFRTFSSSSYFTKFWRLGLSTTKTKVATRIRIQHIIWIYVRDQDVTRSHNYWCFFASQTEQQIWFFLAPKPIRVK